MTYKQLIEKLSQFNEEQLDNTVTLYEENADEFYPAFELLSTDDEDDVLDAHHPYIVFKT